MDSFPADFNSESIRKFDNTNPSLKEQRKRIYTSVLFYVLKGYEDVVFDLPIGMTDEDRQQLARELCERFSGHVDYLFRYDKKEWFVLIEDPVDPPISSHYRIRI